MRIVIVPPVLALLPEYAGQEDPVAELRAAAASAVAWLMDDPGGGPVRVLGTDAQARRIGTHLLESSARTRGGSRGASEDPVLVLANGTAKRTEKAPGHLDPRAEAFDDELGAALAAGDVAALVGLDQGRAVKLWATGIDLLASLSGLRVQDAVVDYADDPFGVAYWVVRWTCAS